MQILTRIVIVCALAATVCPLSSRGADTDAQVKARDALRQKMSELDSQAPPSNVTPPPAARSKAPKTKPAPVATEKAVPTEPAPVVTQPAPVVTQPAPVVTQPAPVVTQPAPVVTQPAPTPAESVNAVPPPTPTPSDTTRPIPPGRQAPARAVEPATPPPVPTAKTPRETRPAPVARTSGPATASRPDSERISKAREALEMKMKELETQGGQPEVASERPANRAAASQPPPTRGPETVATHQPGSSDSNETLPAPPPRQRATVAESKPQKAKQPRAPTPQPEPRSRYALPAAPPPPVSAEKVSKLNALLQQYQADRITPEQYHQERAKILAGP